MLWRLNQTDTVVHAQCKSPVQELRKRYEISVQNGYEIWTIMQLRNVPESMVYVAGFGMGTILAREV